MREVGTKVGEWTACKDGPWYPSMQNGGVVAYRIWKKCDGLTWLQRHEWRNADGTIDMQDWIHSTPCWQHDGVEVEE